MGRRQDACDGVRELLACLMSSPIYFDLIPAERLALLKSLAHLALAPIDRR